MKKWLMVCVCLSVCWTISWACQPTEPTKEQVAETAPDATTEPGPTEGGADQATEPTQEQAPEPSQEASPEPSQETSPEPAPDAAPDAAPDTPAPTDQLPETQADKTTTAGCDKAEQVINTTTSDNVKIAADYWPAKTANRGAVVLVHMIPPNYNRTSYPQRIRQAIQALDLTVINIDRRGAGQSGGTARDAYIGTKTTLDIEAALAYILDPARQCPIDTTKIALIGASNGTTSVLDYTLKRQDQSLPSPKALIWLSPGTYTEQQNKISDHLTALKALPLLMIHPTNEPYSRQYQQTSTSWKIVELTNGGAHGTNNFQQQGSAADTTQTNEILDWLKSHIN